MVEYNNSYNSSRFNSIDSIIDNYESNKVELSNISFSYEYKEIHITSHYILEDYAEILKNECRVQRIPKTFLYKPEYVSYYLYNTPDLWYLVLLVNDCPSFMDFDMKKINVFPPEKISMVNMIIESNKTALLKNKLNPEIIEDMVIKEF